MKYYVFLFSIVLTCLLSTACRPAPMPGPAGSPSPQDTPLVPEVAPDFDENAYPKATAALWSGGFLWTANESGLLTRWDLSGDSYQQFHFPGDAVVRVMAGCDDTIYATTDGGDVWRLDVQGVQTRLSRGNGQNVTALANDDAGNLWYAPAPQDDPEGRPGLVFLGVDGIRETYPLPDSGNGQSTPISVTSIAVDSDSGRLWVGTQADGLLSYDTAVNTWSRILADNGPPQDEPVHDLQLAPDGSLWLAAAPGLWVLKDEEWRCLPLADSPRDIALAGDGSAWIAGEHCLARIVSGGRGELYCPVDNPVLLDRCQLVVLDDAGLPWFIGRRGRIHFDGQTWLAYDADVRRVTTFEPFRPADPTPPPETFPSPQDDYVNWLQTWPRPSGDNGRGLHFLQTHQFDEIEAQRQVNRMIDLGIHWSVVNYENHGQLTRIAPIFQAADIVVIWRPFVRPYETYENWAEDVAYLRSRGIAPYMQLYNEPGLAQEWGERAVDQDVYWSHLLPAVREVYQAGGYVGLQFVHLDWLRQALQVMKAEQLDYTFDRLFFVAHLYGLNHPPEYQEDVNAVLGFQEFAAVFRQEIGFVPVIIAGEGGWRPGEAQDDRFPLISLELYRDYHLVVFEWFQTGRLSNGQDLPDYLFAFCPWLVSDDDDPSAWFDSPTGDKTSLLEAVRALPIYTRSFSWNK